MSHPHEDLQRAIYALLPTVSHDEDPIATAMFNYSTARLQIDPTQLDQNTRDIIHHLDNLVGTSDEPYTERAQRMTPTQREAFARYIYHLNKGFP